MKYIKIVLIMIILILTLQATGCINQEASYEILSDEKGYYIDINGVSTSTIDGASYPARIEFKSLGELKDTFKNCKFTASDLRIMARSFRKDEDGKIRVPDFDNLYYPIFPGETMMRSLSVKSDTYAFSATLDGSIRVMVDFISDEIYPGHYEYYYEGFYNNENINITEQVFDEERNANIYYYNTTSGSSKRIRYTLKDDSKTLLVEEKYRLASDEVPSEIIMYGEQDNVKFFSYLLYFSERPSEEWLLGIGIEKYVEE